MSRPEDPYAHLDAAYVLGALDPAERADFEAHLSSCPQCRAAVDEMAATARLLDGLPEAAFGSTEPAGSDRSGRGQVDGPPDTLWPGLLLRARRERRRRNLLTGSLAVAAAACLLALVVVAWPSGRTSTPAALAMTPVVASPVTATATVQSVRWGTEIHLDCYYATPENESQPYSLVVVPRTGTPENLGSWNLTPGRETQWNSGTALATSQIKAFQVTYQGHVILQLEE